MRSIRELPVRKEESANACDTLTLMGEPTPIEKLAKGAHVHADAVRKATVVAVSTIGAVALLAFLYLTPVGQAIIAWGMQ